MPHGDPPDPNTPPSYWPPPPEITLRKYFAGQALAGMLAVGEEGTAEQIAEAAYSFADAMIAHDA